MIPQINKQYITDHQGNKKAVIVPLDEWRKIVEALEELEDIREYEEAKSHPSDPIPFEQAVKSLRGDNGLEI